MSGVTSAPACALVGVYDSRVDHQRLLAATLYGLGCRIMPLDCGIDAVEHLAGQLAAGAPDVLVWQSAPDQAHEYALLVSMLNAGVLPDTRVVLTTSSPADAVVALRPHRVQVVGAPYTLTALMHAVAAASDE